MGRQFERYVVFGDLHSGHFAGLTPPEWWYPIESARRGIAYLQRETFNWFADEVQSIKPIDTALLMGDLIDGNGHRSGGTELITTDRQEQCDIAKSIIKGVGAKRHRFVYGTSYHTGQEEDFEKNIADEFGAKISDQAWVEKYGVVFHMKHHVGGTSIPHGKGTALMKDMLWNDLWADMQAQPRANIFLRGHTHRYIGIDDVGPSGNLRMGFCLPALQSAQTKFGGRRCSGIVHYGFMHFDVYKDGSVRWQKHMLNVQAAIPQVENL